MPSPRRHPRRSIYRLLLLGLVVAAGAILVRATLHKQATGFLAGWGALGLPGSVSAREGPSIAFAWPPEIGWQSLRWQDENGRKATCRSLRLCLSPGSLFQGKPKVDAIVVEEIDLNDETEWSRWTGVILGVFPDTVCAMEPGDRPSPGAIRVTVRSAHLGSDGPRIERVDGWVYSARRGSWGCRAAIRFEAGRHFSVRATGEGSANHREATAWIESATGAGFRFAWRHPVSLPPSWQLSATGLGSLLDSALPRQSGSPASLRRSSLSFQLSSQPGGRPDGEIHFEGLPFSEDEQAPVDLAGTLCFGGGGITLEECTFRGPGTDLVLRAELLTTPGSPPGHGSLSGRWRGRPLSCEGSLTRLSVDGLRLALDTIVKGEVEAGPADLRVLWGGERPRTATAGITLSAEGTAQIGGGTLRLAEARTETGSVTFVLEPERIRIEDLAPWLPFPLSGNWSGLLDGQGSFALRRDGWTGHGVIEIRGGHVEMLPFLSEILERSVIDPGRTALRFDSLATRWWYEAGEIFADPIRVEGRDLLIDGSVYYLETADSLAVWLRLRPAADRLAGQLLRLLGEEQASVEFAVRGRTDALAVTPIRGEARDAWIGEFARIRQKHSP